MGKLEQMTTGPAPELLLGGSMSQISSSDQTAVESLCDEIATLETERDQLREALEAVAVSRIKKNGPLCWCLTPRKYKQAHTNFCKQAREALEESEAQ
jgi:hypothetical protein